MYVSVLNVSCDHIYSVPIALGRVAQSVACLTQEPEVTGSIPGPVTFFLVSPSVDSRKAAVSYWRQYRHLVSVTEIVWLG